MKLALEFNIREVFPPAEIYPTTEGVGKLAGDILLILTSAAAALSIIFIIIAGFKYVTSSGDEKKLASAHATLMYAIIGLAVTILAFVILRVVQFFFGASVPVAA